MKIIRKYIVSIILLVLSISIFSCSFIPFYQKDIDYYDSILDEAYKAEKPLWATIKEYEQKMNNSYAEDYLKYSKLYFEAMDEQEAFHEKEITPYHNRRAEINKKRNKIQLILWIASGSLLLFSIASFFFVKLEAKKKDKKKNTPKSNLTQADELKKFKELLDSGALTQEEFEQKKKEILGL